MMMAGREEEGGSARSESQGDALKDQRLLSTSSSSMHSTQMVWQ